MKNYGDLNQFELQQSACCSTKKEVIPSREIFQLSLNEVSTQCNATTKPLSKMISSDQRTESAFFEPLFFTHITQITN